MDQTTKLEPFILLSKNAKGKAAADLIRKVTEDPNIYAFGELLGIPGIREVRQSPSIVYCLRKYSIHGLDSLLHRAACLAFS